MLFAGCGTAAERFAPARVCDYEGPSGICVRFDANAKRINPAALEAAYLEARREVETRYRLNLSGVAGPVVHVMNFADFARLHPVHNRLDGDTTGHHGWTSFDSGEIALTGPAIMRHEAFHYLLWKAGYPNALNAVHDHPAFDEYRDGQWLPKRAGTSPDATPHEPPPPAAAGSANDTLKP